MAGIVKGRHSIALVNRDSMMNSQESYISLYKALELIKAAGYISRVALYYGDGGASGMDYHDEANPCGDNSFVVYRFPPYGSRTWSWYFLIQWCSGATFGVAGNGSPGTLTGFPIGSSGGNLGIQSAVGMTAGFADENPWAGTTNNDGTDAKSDPVWSATNLWVYPRSNSGEGAHSTSRQNCSIITCGLASVIDNDTFINVFADNDSLLLIISCNDTYQAYRHVYIGPYIPIKNTVPTAPLVHLAEDKDNVTYAPTAYVFGNLDGSSDSSGGVYVENDKSVRPVVMGVQSRDLSITDYINPNYSLSSSVVISESPFSLYADETEAVVGRRLSGLVGYIDTNMMTYIPQWVDVGTTLNSGSKIVWGNTNNFNECKFTSPWDGSVPNFFSHGRDGVDF